MKKFIAYIIFFLLVFGSSDLAQAQDVSFRNAIANGNAAKVEKLINQGANVRSKQSGTHFTPLHFATFSKRNSNSYIAKMLIDAGADVNAKTKNNGETPLIYASLNGHTEIVKLLIEAGADINLLTKKGRTAMYWAQQKSHTQIVELLKNATETTEPDVATTKPKHDLSFFSVEELKEMYKQAIIDKDDENMSLIEGELTNRTKTSENTAEATTLTRGGGDPLKGLNVSAAKEKMEIGNYYALIIGIDNYKGAWSPLKNAVGDAKAVESLIKAKYKFDHFNTLYNEHATRKNIIIKLQWLVDNVRANDNVFIYYSGHGEYKKDLNKGYWVPVEAQTTGTYEFISNSEIQTFLNGIKSNHTLLISDACFSGDIFRGNTISVPFEQSSKYYNKVHALKSRQAFTSGGVEPVMDGGRDGHSVFTYYLLQMLKRNDAKYYDTGQLYNDMKIPVTNNSDQTPMLQPVKNTGDEGGQFIFLKKPGTD